MRYLKYWPWKFIYEVYPPILRVLEKIGIHSIRQNFLIGHLKAGKSPSELGTFLRSQGYETAILAWMDPGEILSLRKLEEKMFQFHVRLFNDGEIRAHYEYSPEGNPWGHVIEKVFEERKSHFEKLLYDFLD